ncbi:MAG: hypothetical protein KDD10_26035, partial [Phaeodactylibacter sp.]|nr:hypothetical protein [Phaeodactylibacter sp.]
MKKRILLTAPFLLSACFLLAQACRIPAGGEFLHANNVRAFINSGGGLFLKGRKASFEVPVPGQAHTIFAQGLWLGALDAGGNLKLAAQTYGLIDGQTDYYAGPLGESGSTTAENCRNWDRVWTVFRYQVDTHIRDFEDNGAIDNPIPDIMGWPGKGNPFFEEIYGFELPDTPQGLAPFFDRDGNGIYNPLAGDYPMVRQSTTLPEQITWSIFNDVGGIHSNSFGDPLTVEVHLTAWAYLCANNPQLNNAIFTSYKVINRGTASLDSLYLGLWVDFDLGCLIDDVVGSAPALNTAFVYNLGNNDETNCDNVNNGYGLNPPVQAATVLNKNLSYVTYSLNRFPGLVPPALYDPVSPVHYYRYLTGRCQDGTPFTFGGNGYDPSLSNPVARFVFPGDPNDPGQWSDLNDGQGTGDRRIVSSLLIESLPPGGSEDVDVAYSYFREPGADHLGNVTAMYEGIENLQAWYDGQFGGICTPGPVCREDCVWTGDANADGIANHIDLLALAVGAGRQGPARSGPYNWSPRAGQAWPTAQPNGANDKHLDADGDGTATFDDFRFTRQHYNFTRPGYQPAAEYREGPELQLLVNDSLFDFNNLAAGQGAATGRVLLTKPVPELYALAFTLEYDTAYFDPMIITAVNNPFGHIVFATHFYSMPLVFPLDFDFARVATDGIIEKGHIMSVRIKVKENYFHPLPSDTTLIRFKNIKAIRRDGSEIEIGGTAIVARFPGITGTAEEEAHTEDIRLFP